MNKGSVKVILYEGFIKKWYFLSNLILLNLEKFNKDDLILLNLEKFNKDDLNKYLIKHNIALPYEHILKKIDYYSKTFPSWGIIFEFEDEEYYSFLFILELYLNTFLKPLFKFDRLGFEKLQYNYFDTFKDGYLNKIDIKRLYSFLNNFKGIIDYSYWLRPRIYEWVKYSNNEAFRLHTGIGLYKLLEKYSNSKSTYFWKKEVMEIGILLETLFTQPSEKESIGYVLRKRIHFLSIDLVDDIEKKVKEIYSTRSNFVHGSVFDELRKKYEIIEEDGEEDIKEIITHDMFEKTKEYITILRKILLLYYKVFEGINIGEYNSYFKSGKKISCIDVIELSMFDIKVRKKFQKNVKLISSLIEY